MTDDGCEDDLVRAYLQNRHARWAARIDDELTATATPAGRILAVFDALAAQSPCSAPGIWLASG